MPITETAMLPYFLQDDLYLLPADKGSFNAKAIEPQPAEETLPPVFNCMGDPSSGFLILVNYPADEYIAETHVKPLEGILGRKNITLANVAIFNTGKNDLVDFDQVVGHFKPKKVLILGAHPARKKAFPLNEIATVDDISILLTDSFEDMLPNDEKKRAFWNQMKNF